MDAGVRFRQFFSIVRADKVVADAVIWPDGDVSMKWRGIYGSAVYWSAFADAAFIHGHPDTSLTMGLREELS